MDVELAEVRDFLAAHHPYSQLPEAVLRELPKRLVTKYFRRGATLIEVGQKNDYLHIVRSGGVHIIDGHGVLADTADPGESFGLSSVWAGAPSRFRMVAVDDATVANGCLAVVPGRHHELLPTDASGCIRPDVVDSMAWEAVEVPAGSTLWFHSRTPHRSGPNRSPVPRRALYPTYNARSEGDLRADYYREKLARFTSAGGRADGKVQVSLIDDFQGLSVR